MGLARGTLERAERGDSVHPGTAKVIADFYGVKVTDIWPVEDRTAA
jgi:lambda repressor-like predicted transcriptional regulator